MPPAKKAASREYLKALTAWTTGKDGAASLAALDRAIETDPEDPVCRYMHGVMALKFGSPERALQSFSAGEKSPDIPHRVQAARLWQARALTVLGRKADADSLIAGVATSSEASQSLREAASQDGRAPFTLDKMKDILPDFVFGDVYKY